MDAIALRILFVVEKAKWALRYAPLVVLVVVVANQALLSADGGELYCFLCGCNIVTHFFPAPYGCYFLLNVGLNCYNHPEYNCMYIEV